MVWGLTAAFGASAAGAHEAHPLEVAEPWTEILARVGVGSVLLVSTVALSGLLIASLVTGSSPSLRLTRRAEVPLAWLGVAADLAVIVAGAPLADALGGWPGWLAVVHLGLLLFLLGWETRPPFATAGLAVALWLTLGAAGHSRWPGWSELSTSAVGAVHVGAAAVWVGTVLHLLFGWRRVAEGQAWLAAAIRRLTPVAGGAALVTLASGLWNMALHGAWSRALPSSSYGWVLVAKAALLVPAAVAVGAVVRHRAGRTRQRLRSLGALLTADGVVFAAVLTLASALVILPSPQAGRDPGVALLRRVRLGDEWMTVTVSPQRPGENVIHILGAGAATAQARLLDDDIPLAPQENGGRSGAFQLSAGRSRLSLSSGGSAAQILLDTGRPRRGAATFGDFLPVDGPDRAECASRHLGRLIALTQASVQADRRYQLVSSLVRVGQSQPVPVPSPGRVSVFHACASGPSSSSPEVAAIERAPAAGATAIVRFLEARGVRRVLILGDGAQRAREFSDQAKAMEGTLNVAVDVVDAIDTGGSAPGEPRSLDPPDAVVIATGWEHAKPALEAVASRPGSSSRGIYLAPWLMDPELLRAGLDLGAVQISIGTWLAPTSAPAVAYLRALRLFAPGATPTGAGMAGYLEAKGRLADGDDSDPAPKQTSTRMEFFTPIRLGMLTPAGLGQDHGHDGIGWIPGATLAPIGGAISAGP